ncbi:MAG: hypothetical protein RJA22_2374 [Verrucomicrobiota bacterium]
MQHALATGLWLLGLLAAAAQAPLGRVERLSLFGSEYVRLDHWARANGGQFRWVTWGKEARVTLPSGTTVFRLHSTRVNLRGVETWLSKPIASSGGMLHAAATDFNTTLHPLLFPPKAPAGRVVRTIMLDPGHGGKDPGNKEGRRMEKEYTLILANEVRDLLTRAGFKVLLTRTADTLIERGTRPQMANQRKADLFISLHFNSADGPGGSAVQGAETYSLTPTSASSTHDRSGRVSRSILPGNRQDPRNTLLAWHIQKALVERAGCEDRGMKRARWDVLTTAEMPAALVEAAFMTNPTDARRIYEPAQRRKMAEAIVQGILAYKKTVER